MSNEIEEIKSKLDIAEFISEYLRLTPAGANFKANCPFHNEKTPSFMINRERGIWRCFGCGEGGDVLEFLMKIENISFPEALKVLAQRTGVVLTSHRAEVSTGKNRLYDLCALAANYWHKVLLDSPRAVTVRDYLVERGLTEETIADFKLGYAIDSWDNLLQFLLKRGYSEKEIMAAGLIVRKNQGGYYDRFRNRLMFPIWDYHGRIVGFGGRALSAEETAKYINTPQSEIYNKSEVLYGLYQAKQEIKRTDRTILVEGYMDVIPSHQAKIKNVVSISGTALTEEQIRTLKRYSSNLAIALDRDEAGRVAALRSIDLALQLEMNVSVISVPTGKDPGECVKNNPDDWVRAIDEAKEAMEYFFSEAREGKDLSQSADRKLIVKFMLEKISRLGSEVDRDFWIKRVAQDLSISESLLREAYSRLRPSRQRRLSGESEPAPAEVTTKVDWETMIFQRLLALLIARPQFLSYFMETLPVDWLNNDLPLTIYKKLVLYYNNNVALFSQSAVDKSGIDLFSEFDKWLKSQENQDFLSSYWSDSYLLAQGGFLNLEDKEIKTELNSLLRVLHLASINKKISCSKNELAQAEKDNEQSKIKDVYNQLNELISEKNKLT